MSAADFQWIGEARAALARSPVDHFRVRPWRYWADFLLSVVLAFGAGTIYLLSPLGSWQQWVAFPVAAFWLYRLGSLVHEVCHLGQHEMPVFKAVWNLVVGVMTLTPSPFFTRHHRDHHSLRMYGAPEDPEYIVNLFRPGSVASLLGFVGIMAAFPLLVFLRFFLVPLTYLHPRLREWTLVRASSLTMNHRYRRRVTAADRRAITIMEWLCWIRAVMIPLPVLLGITHWTRMPLLYVLALTVLVLNQLRQLGDHHFHSQGRNLQLPEHIRDSCNFTQPDLLTWLLFPFSIRYHALHHLFPSLPYHNLSAAHACLLAELPADSPYRELDERNWWSVARRTLWSPPPAAAPAPAASPAVQDAA